MPTRAVRTETIANIADFGAIPSDAGSAVTNAKAFRDALATGARRIAIPAGTWWIAEILYGGNLWLPFGIEVFGEGVNLTVLNYAPSNDAAPLFKAYPSSGTPPFARSPSVPTSLKPASPTNLL